MYCDDIAIFAERIRLTLNLNHIFAYYNEYPYKDTVISVPDMNFWLGNGIGGDKGDIEARINECLVCGRSTWTDKRAFWIGNLANSFDRMKLYLYAKKHQDKLLVQGFFSPYGKMLWGDSSLVFSDFATYKYLIDVRGAGWTDRIKYLLALRRPLFLIDRPYKEYWMDDMVPFVHYIPVKEDLSNLIEMYDYMENHPEKYGEIVNNATDFCICHFNSENVGEYYRDVILRYGVRE